MATLSALSVVAITTFLVIVLARALWHKVDRFLETVGFAQGYGAVPQDWVVPAVRALMLVEAATICALIVPQTRVWGGLAAAALFAAYGVLMARALLQGRREIDCGCGGLPQVVSGFALARNAGLTLLAVILSALPGGTIAVRPHEAAAAIGAGLVLTAIYATIERLAAHIPHIRAGIRQEDL